MPRPEVTNQAKQIIRIKINGNTNKTSLFGAPCSIIEYDSIKPAIVEATAVQM
jgi:hypothetical protein